MKEEIEKFYSALENAKSPYKTQEIVIVVVNAK